MQAKPNTLLAMKEFVRNKGWIELPAHGTSMFPLIQEGDICRFSLVEPSTLKKGDILLFHSRDGKLIAHRFIKSKQADNQIHYIFKGDTNLGHDDPINVDQIVGKLTYIKKRDFFMTEKHIIFIIWKSMILVFPILSAFLRSYLTRRKLILSKNISMKQVHTIIKERK
jgi:signal peptidase